MKIVYKVFVLPEPDSPIINILNGQLWSFFSFLLLTISSKFNTLYVLYTKLCFSLILFLVYFFPPNSLNNFDLLIPTELFG